MKTWITLLTLALPSTALAQECAPDSVEPTLASLSEMVDGAVALSATADAVCPLAQNATSGKPMGATVSLDGTSIGFNLYSKTATRIELEVFGEASGADARINAVLTRDANGVWSTNLSMDEIRSAGITGPVYYGYRAWGPNFRYDPSWKPGSLAGFESDVDSAGNRFNPNKLLLDPYALEQSHDSVNPSNLDAGIFASGPQHRAKDSARVAPKGIVLRPKANATGVKPQRAFKDEVIYEVHVRGLTKGDESIPEELRGTYKGAAMKAAYLRSLGITAIELLPVQETQNDTNDVSQGTGGDNYWGYMTTNYFAPDRRYSSDKRPGGPTREFQEMVKAYHAAGIKVYTDVVYNHTGEGGNWDASGDTASLLSFRGIDNATYYELANDKRFNYDNTGVGGNLNAANDVTRNLVLDSLKHWKDTLGVDGFRFDLASVLGNRCTQGCFDFDKMDPCNPLNRATRELAGADLIAEPWAIGGNSYQVGGFPSGWAEWNGKFRDTFRKDQNRMGIDAVTPGELATRFAGSRDLYQDDGRKPWHSVNFITAHDGFSLNDLYAYDRKMNGGSWPFGPSDGGEDHNNSWNQGGDRAMQRQAARNGMAFLMLSSGVPMITGGDEFLRTQYGNNNAYNLDSEKNWIEWQRSREEKRFADYTKRLIAFRKSHPALRPANFFNGRDNDGNGMKDITWYTDAGHEADGRYMDDPDKHFVGYRIDGAEVAGESAASIFVAYNGWSGPVSMNLPAPRPGMAWHRMSDTASWMEGDANFSETGTRLDSRQYGMHGRTVAIFVEQPITVASNR